MVPHDQQRSLLHLRRGGLSGKAVADPQGKGAGKDRVPEGIAQAGEGDAPGLAVGAEDGDGSGVTGGEIQPSAMDGGDGGPLSQQEAGRAPAGQIEQDLEIGVGVVQPPAQAAVEKKGFVTPSESR